MLGRESEAAQQIILAEKILARSPIRSDALLVADARQ